MKDRYGGLEEIKRTVAEDPAGFLADIAGLAMGGGGLAAKAAGTAGKVGSVVSKAGRAIDPVRLASAGAKRAGKAASTAVSEVLGLMGPEQPPRRSRWLSGEVRQKVRAKGKAFLESIKGDVPMDQVVEEARAAVGKMHKAKIGSLSNRDGISVQGL